jgi:hypothetical protein
MWRLFTDRKEATEFLHKFTGGDKKAQEWAHQIPLASAGELKSFH